MLKCCPAWSIVWENNDINYFKNNYLHSSHSNGIYWCTVSFCFSRAPPVLRKVFTTPLHTHTVHEKEFPFPDVLHWRISLWPAILWLSMLLFRLVLPNLCFSEVLWYCPSSAASSSSFILGTLWVSELRSICEEWELNCFYNFSHVGFKGVIIKQASTQAHAEPQISFTFLPVLKPLWYFSKWFVDHLFV